MNCDEVSYVLITPARNEVHYIEKTIQSVLSQTKLPRKWVIVSDGSTDGTDDVVKSYAENHGCIEFVRMPEHQDRQFAAKVNCFNSGFARLRDIDYDIIGNLDADITFGEDYFEFLMGQFAQNPELGVAGTPFVEDDGKVYNYTFTNVEHVSGACQLFRRRCFDEIGGYMPIKGGGVDWAAVTTARMKGWKTRTFTGRICYHHRTMGSGNCSSLVKWFRHGVKDFYLGGHPLWQVFRAVYQMRSMPYIISGVSLLAGYLWALLSRVERPISRDLIEFHRSEQIKRLKRTIRSVLHGNLSRRCFDCQSERVDRLR